VPASTLLRTLPHPPALLFRVHSPRCRRVKSCRSFLFVLASSSARTSSVSGTTLSRPVSGKAARQKLFCLSPSLAHLPLLSPLYLQTRSTAAPSRTVAIEPCLTVSPYSLYPRLLALPVVVASPQTPTLESEHLGRNQPCTPVNMSYYNDPSPSWTAPGRQASWEQPAPPSRSGMRNPKNLSMGALDNMNH
jgi:hypothetical protein